MNEFFEVPPGIVVPSVSHIFYDLSDLKLDDRGVVISFGMVLGKYSDRFFSSVLHYEPTRLITHISQNCLEIDKYYSQSQGRRELKP
jgi:hypothetical protein